MKINSKMTVAFFAIVLARSIVDSMIIKKDLGNISRLHNKGAGSNIERRLMDQIEKEKDKNRILKDLLAKQENLSKELDQKIEKKVDDKIVDSKKVADSTVSQDVSSKVKANDEKPRELSQNKNNTTDANKPSDNKSVKTNDKAAKTDNNRKLTQTNAKNNAVKNTKQAKSVVDNKKSKPAAHNTSRKLNNKQPATKDIRKLKDDKTRKRLQTQSPTKANTVHNVAKKRLLKKVDLPNQKPKVVAQKQAPKNKSSAPVKRQLNTKTNVNKTAVKKLAMANHDNIQLKPIIKKVAVNQVNNQKNRIRHSTTSNDENDNRRKLNQNKSSPSIKGKSEDLKNKLHVTPSKNLKKIVSKPVVAKRKLYHATVQSKNAPNKRIAQTKKAVQKGPSRWTKHSRKLVGEKNKKRKHSNRILDEAENAADYPVKLMNASISYPILGMVNLGSGEYDLHIS